MYFIDFEANSEGVNFKAFVLEKDAVSHTRKMRVKSVDCLVLIIHVYTQSRKMGGEGKEGRTEIKVERKKEIPKLKVSLF